MSQESPDSSSKPKQLKFPNQVYIDLPLWRDEPQSPGGLGEGGLGAGGQGGQAEVADDPSTTTSTSSASTTPQHTPTNSLKRTSARRRTDSVLYGCGSLLASLVLGYDIREALKGSVPADDCDPPREEKKKKEGLFQRATRFRRSTSPPGGRPRRDEASPGQQGAAQPVNLISMSAIIECNSTKCLLQSEAEVSQSSPGKAEPAVVAHHTEPPGVGSVVCTEGRSPTPTTNATQTTVQTQSQPTETSKHNTGSRLRRKKYHNNHNSEPDGHKDQHPLFDSSVNALLSVSSQRSAHSVPSSHAEEGRSSGEGLRWPGFVQTATRVIPGQAPRLGPVEGTQQELLARPLLWRESGPKPEHGAVLGGLLPAGHGHGGPEAGLHGAALPHPEFSRTAVCL